MKKDLNKIVKIIILILLILVLIPISIKLWSIFKNIATPEGREIFKEEITSMGFSGVWIIIGLMIAQVFLVFLPGEPVEILAGMCYGSIGGLIVIYIGAFLSGCLIMFLIRILGKNFIYSFVSKEKFDKLENKLKAKTKNLETILILLFAVPGSQKDLLTYIGAFLPIKPMKFLLISTLARFPSIISSTIVGNNLLEGNWIFIISTYVVTFAVSGIILYLYNKKDKIDDIMDIK